MWHRAKVAIYVVRASRCTYIANLDLPAGILLSCGAEWLVEPVYAVRICVLCVEFDELDCVIEFVTRKEVSD